MVIPPDSSEKIEGKYSRGSIYPTLIPLKCFRGLYCKNWPGPGGGRSERPTPPHGPTWLRAEQIWQDALKGYRRLVGGAGDYGASVSELLGQNLTKQRKYEEAELLLHQALAFREKSDPDSWQRFRAQAFLGST
jgi:hypothetical protein